MKLLSSSNRLEILAYIDKWEKSVSEIVEKTDISQSQVSQYLSQMKLSWILKSTRKWKIVEYSITDKKILKLLNELKDIFL